jgi:hypothetical protein
MKKIILLLVALILISVFIYLFINNKKMEQNRELPKAVEEIIKNKAKKAKEYLYSKNELELSKIMHPTKTVNFLIEDEVVFNNKADNFLSSEIISDFLKQNFEDNSDFYYNEISPDNIIREKYPDSYIGNFEKMNFVETHIQDEYLLEPVFFSSLYFIFEEYKNDYYITAIAKTEEIVDEQLYRSYYGEKYKNNNLQNSVEKPDFNNEKLNKNEECPAGYSITNESFTGAEFVNEGCKKNSQDAFKVCESSNDCTHRCITTNGNKVCPNSYSIGEYYPDPIECKGVKGICEPVEGHFPDPEEIIKKDHFTPPYGLD